MSALALGILLTAVTLLGLVLNLYIILVVILSKQVHTANNLLLLHLGVVDVCVGAVLGALLLCGGGGDGGGGKLILDVPELPRAALSAAAPCSLPGFLLYLLHPVALWTLCGLHTDRYFAISTPLHYGAKVSTRKVLWGLGVSWLGSLLLTLLALLPACGAGTHSGLAADAPEAAATPADPGGTAAWTAPWTAPWVPWAPWGPVLHAAIYTATTLLLPATIVLVCNLKVLMIARHHRHRIASAIFEVTLSAQVTITHQRNPFVPLAGGSQASPEPRPPGISPGTAAAVAAAAAVKYRSRSALCPVLQLLGSLLLLYFPYYGLLLWDALAASKAVQAPHPHFSTIALCLITCSPPVNGLLYGVKNKVLRKTIHNYWRKQMSKSEVNQEIQARTPSTCGSRRPSLTPAGAGLGAGLGAGTGMGAGTSSSTLQRRLSEIVLEPLRSSVSVGSASPRTSKFQRIASDLVWRPSQWGLGSLQGLRLGLGRSLNSIEHQDLRRSRSMKDALHHSSNTLQIPSVTSNGDLNTGTSNVGAGRVVASPGGSLFVQRVLGHCHVGGGAGTGTNGPRHSPSLLLASVSRRSPRILITRAFSEENDSGPAPAPWGSSSPGASSTTMQHSTSASALVTERRWRRIRYRDEAEQAEQAELVGEALSGPPSDESSSPSEHRPLDLNLSDGEGGDGEDGQDRVPLFSPVFSPLFSHQFSPLFSPTSASSPISSPELPELPELPEPSEEDV